MKRTINRNNIERIYSFLLALLPLLNVYPVASTSFSVGELCVLAFAPIALLSRKRVILDNVAQKYSVFIVYAITISLTIALSFSEISLNETVRRLVRDGLYILIFAYISPSFLDFDVFKKTFTVMCIALTTFIIVQFSVYAISHRYIPGVISSLYPKAGEIQRTSLRTASYIGFLRPNGFLKEPSHCAQVMSVGLILHLIGDGKGPNWKTSIILTVGILFTTSANGFFLIITCYALYAFMHIGSKNATTVFKAIGVITVGLIVFYIMYLRVPFMQRTVDRILNVSEGTEGSSSLRVLRGFAFFNKMPLSGKVFGLGFGNFLGYRAHFNIWTQYEFEKEYMASDIYIVTSVGIFGSLILLATIVSAMKKKNDLGKGLLILLLIIGVSSSVYSGSVYAIILSLVFSCMECDKILFHTTGINQLTN